MAKKQIFFAKKKANFKSLHPSERDYSNITSSNQKYCASIFYRGWQLKSQTLYSQYKWFEQFESYVISKMDPSPIDERENFIDGSNGVINVDIEKISVNYAIMGHKLFLTISGKNQDIFIKRGTKIGFEYGTVNQAGKTVRSRKLQTWGFLDFIRINKKSPHNFRIFEIDLDLYEDYKNRVNYIVNEKIAWIGYALNKNKVKKPSTWVENKSAEWVSQTRQISNKTVRDFFFHQVKPLRGYSKRIKAFKAQNELHFVDIALDADLCVIKAIEAGKKGILNSTMNEIVNNLAIAQKKSKIVSHNKVEDVVSESDAYLALKGLKQTEVDNENKGASRLFINRITKLRESNLESSPLIKYGILTEDQYKTCEFELGWGLKDWRGFLRSDTFAPDILVTNGIMGINREIYAIIQLKGRSRTIAKPHATGIFFQLMELKKYKADSGINTAMVIIESDIKAQVAKYKWLIFHELDYRNNHKISNKLNKIFYERRDNRNILLDPILYRNARCRKIVKQIYKSITSNQINLKKSERSALKLIFNQINSAYDRFAAFTFTKSLKYVISEPQLNEAITCYVNDIKPLIRGLIELVALKKINNYSEFQKKWNKTIYKHYYNRILKHLGIKPVFNTIRSINRI
ncbi:MAG: hypothetical protein ACFFB5_00385 [Promethearchaeota archaeon]